MSGAKIQASPEELERFATCLSEFSCGISSDCEGLQRAFEQLGDTLDEESKQVVAGMIKSILSTVAEQDDVLKNLEGKVHNYAEFVTRLKKITSSEAISEERTIDSSKNQTRLVKRLAEVVLAMEMKEALNASEQGYETTHGYRASKVLGEVAKSVSHVQKVDFSTESTLGSITDGIGKIYDAHYAQVHSGERIDFSASSPPPEQIEAHTLIIDPKDI